ncbi:MAG: ATP-binding protein, partial [Gammaproteobacteria bacterium]|nr:ATP-binding protein [Gammaproteobacteria bacterium]
ALGQNPKIMKSGKQSAYFYKTMWTTLLADEVWQGEMLNKRKNGSLYWEFATISPIKDTAGKTTHYVAIKEDITARKQAEITALEHRDQLVTFMETLPDAVILKDNKGRWLLTNHAGRKLFRLDEHSWTGKTDTELSDVHPELISLHKAFTIGDEETWRHKEITVSYEEIKTSDNQINILELRKMPIFGLDNEPKAMVIISRDITKQRTNEAMLIDAQQHAEAANQAKSEFLSNMSHELRTPMNAILGFAQLMTFNDTLDQEQQDNLNEISIAGNHLLDLINEILDLAKIESGHINLIFEQINLTELVEECFSLIKPVADKAQINITHRDTNGYFVHADRTRLKQVILNLLSNAIKYNRKQGSVELTAQAANNEDVRITISDTGKGIQKEKLKELFQPFSRLGAEASDIEGTGIGLTITRNLVEKMNGQINVDSMPGVGSQFWIELPQQLHEQLEQVEETIKPDDNIIKEIPVTGLKQRTILHIEDNPINIKLVDQILGNHKHINLISSQDAKLGLELASLHKPELILTDIKMPQMDGYELLSILKSNKHLKDIPIIAITANAMPKDIEQGLAAGFTDYLTKPLDVEQFIYTIEQQLNNKAETITAR